MELASRVSGGRSIIQNKDNYLMDYSHCWSLQWPDGWKCITVPLLGGVPCSEHLSATGKNMF